MNHEESITWTMDLAGRFTEPMKVRSKIPEGRVFWVAGEHDVLVDPVITKAAAAEYSVDMAVVKGAGQCEWRCSPWVLLSLTFWIRPSYAE